MQFTKLAKRIVHIVGILAVVLLLVLLCVYLIFGRKAKEEREGAGANDFTTISLIPFSEEDPVLNADLMKEYDFTVLEIWLPDSTECVRYKTEMNLFAEECLHRDDEMYAYVTGVCVGLNDRAGTLMENRLKLAKDVCERESVNYHQYIADKSTEEILSKLEITEYPTVIFLNREGQVLDIVDGMDGKELCMHLDLLVEEYMREKRRQEWESAMNGTNVKNDTDTPNGAE